MAAYRRPSTPAEQARADSAREDKLQALHQAMREQIEALTTGADWTRWLQVAARFHDYSFRNTMLILAQRPDAQLVAGYSAWQQLGRQVTKGERGIAILAPVTRRRNNPADQETAAVAGRDRPTEGAEPADRAAPHRAVVGWRPTYVWDLAQTSGEPLPTRPAPRLLAGTAPPGLWDGLAAQVTAAGFTLERGPCGDANGYTDHNTRVVRVRTDIEPAQAVKTLAHELGHVLLHGPGTDDLSDSSSVVEPAAGPAGLDGEPPALCRGRAEVEAESVAYLICSASGADTAGYTFPYVAGWAQSVARPETGGVAAVVEATGRRVLATARTVLGGLETTAAAEAGRAGTEDLHAVAERADRGAARTAGLRARAETTAATQAPAPSPAQVPGAPDEHGRLLAAHSAAAKFYRAQLGEAQSGEPRAYLAARGLGYVLPDADTGPVGGVGGDVGYAPPGWTGLCEHLRELGYSDTELLASGLGLRTRKDTVVDRFRDRIMLPIRRPDGAIVAFVGRAPDHAAPEVPRYLNSPATVLFAKHEHLFGWAPEGTGTDLSGRRVVLVEGPLDAIAVGAALPAVTALAPCGTALTPAQVGLLVRAGVRDLVVAFDADRPGQIATAKAHDLLGGHITQLQAAVLPAGTDPAQLAETCPAALAAALTDPATLVPLADVVLDETTRRHRDHRRGDRGEGDRPPTAEQAAATLNAVAARIATLPPEQVARQIARAAMELDTAIDLLNELVLDAATTTERFQDAAAGRIRARDEQLTLRPAAAAATAGPVVPGPHPAALARAANPTPPGQGPSPTVRRTATERTATERTDSERTDSGRTDTGRTDAGRTDRSTAPGVPPPARRPTSQAREPRRSR